MNKLKHLQKTFILQQGAYDCGVACLASLLKYYGGEIRLVGFDADGMETDGTENLKDLESPVILYVLMEGNLQYYVACYAW